MTDWMEPLEAYEHLSGALRSEWEAEQIESMRSDGAVAMVARRLEEVNACETTPTERAELARKILLDLTTPRIVIPSDESADNPE